MPVFMTNINVISLVLIIVFLLPVAAGAIRLIRKTQI